MCAGHSSLRCFPNIDLVDDMIVFVVPIILGDGIPLFDRVEKNKAQDFESRKVCLRGLNMT